MASVHTESRWTGAGSGGGGSLGAALLRDGGACGLGKGQGFSPDLSWTQLPEGPASGQLLMTESGPFRLQRWDQALGE